MNDMNKTLNVSSRKKIKGAALAEYAVILAVVLVGAITALNSLGSNAQGVFDTAATELLNVGTP